MATEGQFLAPLQRAKRLVCYSNVWNDWQVWHVHQPAIFAHASLAPGVSKYRVVSFWFDQGTCVCMCGRCHIALVRCEPSIHIAEIDQLSPRNLPRRLRLPRILSPSPLCIYACNLPWKMRLTRILPPSPLWAKQQLPLVPRRAEQLMRVHHRHLRLMQVAAVHQVNLGMEATILPVPCPSRQLGSMTRCQPRVIPPTQAIRKCL